MKGFFYFQRVSTGTLLVDIFSRMEGFLLNDTDWNTDLKEKRLAYGVSQNKLAVAAGITRQYLGKIESGSAAPSEEIKENLLQALEWYNPETPLTMLFDYVRIRFPTTDVRFVVETILKLKLDFMIHEDFGFYSYPEHYYMGDIFVLVSPEQEKGVLLELKGKGCRQFENFLLAQHRNWYDFFTDALCEGGVFKRIDLAINDRVGILDIPELTAKCRNEECISVFRSYKSYRSGELVQSHEENKSGMGHTLYIGSLKSEVYFCVYEKDYEQFVKYDIPVEETPVKNRFEIRLKNERAYYAVRDLLTYYDAERTAFSIINRYVRFADKDETKRRSEWQTNERWAWFIGEGRGRLKLTTEPEPYNFQRTLNWLARQVAPTLQVAEKLDKQNNTTVIKDMVKHAKLSDRLEKVLRQLSVTVEEMTVKDKEE